MFGAFSTTTDDEETTGRSEVALLGTPLWRADPDPDVRAAAVETRADADAAQARFASAAFFTLVSFQNLPCLQALHHVRKANTLSPVVRFRLFVLRPSNLGIFVDFHAGEYARKKNTAQKF